MRPDDELISPRVRLRCPVMTDMDGLYALSVNDAVMRRWRWLGATPSPAQFVEHLWQGVLSVMIIETTDTGELVGLVNLYNPRLTDGHAYLSVLIDPAYQGTRVAWEGVSMFIDYGFATWPLRKIMVEAIQSSLDHFASLVRRGTLHEVGRFPDHVFIGGEYEDLVFLQLSRTQWDTEHVTERFSHA